MAVGFIVVAAFKINRKVVTNWMTGILMILAAVVTFFVHTTWVFPLLLLLGGIVSIVVSGEQAPYRCKIKLIISVRSQK